MLLKILYPEKHVGRYTTHATSAQELWFTLIWVILLMAKFYPFLIFVKFVIVFCLFHVFRYNDSAWYLAYTEETLPHEVIWNWFKVEMSTFNTLQDILIVYHYHITYEWFPVNLGQIVIGATCGAGNSHSFWKTWFHSLWGVHNFTHLLYIHYIICQIKDYVYGLMTGLFAWISLTVMSWTYFIRYVSTYPWFRYRFCGLLWSEFLHSIIILLLVLRHEHLEWPSCVKRTYTNVSIQRKIM